MTGDFCVSELMKSKYFRHCKKDVPMFDDEESGKLLETYGLCVDKIKAYRQDRNASLSKAPANGLYQPFWGVYKEISNMDMGFTVEEVMQRHYLSRWSECRKS
jgi:hypothetical protein